MYCQTKCGVTSLGDWFHVSREGGTGGGGLVHPKGENSMACLGFSVGVSEPFRLFLSANGPRK